MLCQFIIIASNLLFFQMTNRNHLTTLVNDYNRHSALITCLNRSPTSILTKLDPHFTSAIESQPNPSQAYKQAMNHLFIGQLNRSLQQQKIKRQGEEGGKRDSLDGVLCQLQKNSLTHQLLQQKKLHLQQQRNERFVDEDKRKSNAIDTLVEKQYDSDLFNHQSDLYQQHQRHCLQHSLSMLNLQRQSKISQHQQAKQQKQKQFQQRKQYQRHLYAQKQQQRIIHKQSQMKYQQQLQNLVNYKKQRDAISNNYSLTVQNRRHNPITNPIEYHIDNPYLLKRMAEQQQL